MSNPSKDQLVHGKRQNIVTILAQTNAQPYEHAGLYFDKYIPAQQQKDSSLSKDQDSPYKTLIDSVACIAEPDVYKQFFNRWQAQIETMRVAIDGCEYQVCSKHAHVLGRLAIGLGDESVIETAVTLHHTYGLPYIPGSALKGLASAYAHQRLEDPRWRKKSELHTLLFGTTSSAGYVTFFDALYVPGSGHRDKESVPRALWRDVITVHHKDYYTAKEPKAPADWDNPTPIPFISATGTYLIALGGPLGWVHFTFKLLAEALKEYGIGAKTSSGYGRMQFDPELKQAHNETSAGKVIEPPHDEATETPQKPLSAPNSSPAQKQPPAQPPAHISAPKPGRDVWGKVIDRRERRWIVRLEEGSFEVAANDHPAKRRVERGMRVKVRIEKSEPLEGTIRDVTM